LGQVQYTERYRRLQRAPNNLYPQSMK